MGLISRRKRSICLKVSALLVAAKTTCPRKEKDDESKYAKPKVHMIPDVQGNAPHDEDNARIVCKAWGQLKGQPTLFIFECAIENFLSTQKGDALGIAIADMGSQIEARSSFVGKEERL